MQDYVSILKTVDLRLFLLSAVLFCVGVVLSSLVVKKNLKVFLWYPLWIWNLVKKHLSSDDSLLKIFFTIFLLNSLSLFVNVISGFLIILPFIFAVLLGMNIGIIILKETGKLNLAVIFLNPVSLFEFPAAWISLSLGMKIGILSYSANVFLAYIFIVIPLLIISGITETVMIKLLAKHVS
ncbi:MAG: stage II sporulation protein M [Deltaproteobacteria bacterium]|nr:stage II sporulation protein M [Deltaproteobacteria bacterium]